MTNFKEKGIQTIGILTAAALVFLMLTGASQTPAQEITPEIFSQLRYRPIGPPGNRTAAVVGVPGDPLVYYIAHLRAESGNPVTAAAHGRDSRATGFPTRRLERSVLQLLRAIPVLCTH